MIEKIVLDYLSEKMDCKVYMEEPEDKLDKYVLLEKTGSSETEGGINTAVLAVQSYGSTLYEAAKLNYAVKAAMRDMIVLPQIVRCRLNSDYNYTDTQTKRYRYQAVFDIYYYYEE